MRTDNEIMDLIMNKARNDERIRAVVLWGSRADKDATHDRYCDFDVVYIVEDIRSFTRDISWLNYWGEMLILQMPNDWYKHRYDYNGTGSFVYLMQFKDGTRIDLTLIEKKNIDELVQEKEPRTVLLNKDEDMQIGDITENTAFLIKRPDAKEYFDTCNEFWWLSVNVAKGICREEFCFVKMFMEQYQMEMLHKMISWKIGIKHDFAVTTGKADKYFKRYLPDGEMSRIMNLYPSGDYNNIREKLFSMFDYFGELSEEVGNHFGFEVRREEAKNVRAHVEHMLKDK